MSDLMTVPSNPERLVPTVNSLAGTRLFTVGESTQPLAVGSAPAPLSSILALTGYNNTPITNARLDALQAALNTDLDNDIVNASNDVHREAIRISRTLNDGSEVITAFPNTDIGNQLKQIARLIKSRTALHMNRQIFFCTLDGFDTHTQQVGTQQLLFSRFSQASRAFYDEINGAGHRR